METKYRTIAEVILILGLVVMGGMKLIEDKAMYCPSRKIALNCDRTTATRCYHDDTYKVCPEGWKPLVDLVEAEVETEEPETINVAANGGIYVCTVEDGYVWSYSRCSKKTGGEGYLGELIPTSTSFTTSPDRTICYLNGDLRRGVSCEELV